MSDQVGTPEDRFSHVAAHLKLGSKGKLFMIIKLAIE